MAWVHLTLCFARMPQNYPTSPYSKYVISVSDNTFHKLGETLDEIDMPVHSNLRDKFVNLLTSCAAEDVERARGFSSVCRRLISYTTRHAENEACLQRLQASRDGVCTRAANQTQAITKCKEKQTTLLQNLATYMESQQTMNVVNITINSLRVGYDHNRLVLLPGDINATTNLIELRECLKKHWKFFVFATVEENRQVMHAVIHATYRMAPLIQDSPIPSYGNPVHVIKFDHQLAAIRREYASTLATRTPSISTSLPEPVSTNPRRLFHGCFVLLQRQAGEYGQFMLSRRLAFMMGNHRRDNNQSPVRLLNRNLIERILAIVLLSPSGYE